METQLNLKDYITRADVNEAVENKEMTEKEAVIYVTDTTACEYFNNLYNSSDDSSDSTDDSSEDVVELVDTSDESEDQGIGVS